MPAWKTRTTCGVIWKLDSSGCEKPRDERTGKRVMKMRTMLAALIAVMLTSFAATAQTSAPAQGQAQEQEKPKLQRTAPGYTRGNENLSCAEREARCYDSRGLCERYCQPQQASKADPQATGECFARCSRGSKQCLEKLPGECNVLSDKNTRPLPKIEPK
jgi:hypothetical protein